jgi:HEPN domain-containing protein
MAADPPKPDPRVIVAYLDDVELELDAARRLVADPPNRFAAFHLQQAAEKLVKAVRLGRGLRVTVDHDIALLAEELSPDAASPEEMTEPEDERARSARASGIGRARS